MCRLILLTESVLLLNVLGLQAKESNSAIVAKVMKGIAENRQMPNY